MNENIREKCIYNLVSEYNEIDDLIYLNYMYNVRFSCLEVYGKITETCANREMRSLGIITNIVKECMKNSILINESQHMITLLEEDRE